MHQSYAYGPGRGTVEITPARKSRSCWFLAKFSKRAKWWNWKSEPTEFSTGDGKYYTTELPEFGPRVVYELHGSSRDRDIDRYHELPKKISTGDGKYYTTELPAFGPRVMYELHGSSRDQDIEYHEMPRRDSSQRGSSISHTRHKSDSHVLGVMPGVEGYNSGPAIAASFSKTFASSAQKHTTSEMNPMLDSDPGGIRESSAEFSNRMSVGGRQSVSQRLTNPPGTSAGQPKVPKAEIRITSPYGGTTLLNLDLSTSSLDLSLPFLEIGHTAPDPLLEAPRTPPPLPPRLPPKEADDQPRKPPEVPPRPVRIRNRHTNSTTIATQLPSAQAMLQQGQQNWEQLQKNCFSPKPARDSDDMSDISSTVDTVPIFSSNFRFASPAFTTMNETIFPRRTAVLPPPSIPTQRSHSQPPSSH